MRLVTLLALLLALATTAGCFGGGDDDAEGTPATPTPTATPTVTPTVTPTSPAGGANNTGGSGTGGSGATPAQPKEIENSQFDFSQNNPVAPAAPKAVTVPAGVTKVNLTVTFTPSAPVSPQNAVAVTFTDAAGTAISCAVKANPMTAAETCEALGAVAPGEGQLSYAGEGLVRAQIVIMVS